MAASNEQLSLEELRRQRNVLSEQIGKAKRAGAPTEELIRQSRDLSAEIKELEKQLDVATGQAEPGKIICETADTVEQVLGLEQEWRELSDVCPDAPLYVTWEWMSAWYEAYAPTGQIRCLQARRDGQLLGLAPLFRPARRDYQLQANQLGFGGNYGPAWSFYPEFLLRPGAEELAMRALMDSLCEEPSGWASLKLLRMRPDSPTLALLMAEAPRHGLRVYARPGLLSSVTELPDDPGKVLDVASSNFRGHCRSAQRKLAEEHPRARLALVEDPQEIVQRLEDMAQLNIMRHDLKGIISNFRKPAFREHFMSSSRRLLDSGHLRMGIIELDGETIAASTMGFYRDTAILLNTGFLPSFGRYRPSHLLAIELAAQAVREGLEWLDMLSYYHYKADLCPVRKYTTDAVVFPDSVQGLMPVTRELLNRTARTSAKAALRRMKAAFDATKQSLQPQGGTGSTAPAF